MVRCSLPLLFAGLALLAGCEPALEPSETVRVVGKVTWHGQPIRRGTVVFCADTQRSGHSDLAIGILNFDGSYELITAEGLPPRPGNYRVTLLSDDERIVLPTHLADPTSSGLSISVAPPGPVQVNWALPITRN